MGIFNRLSDKIAGRPSSSVHSSSDTADIAYPTDDPCSSPIPRLASSPYGLAWSPLPLPPGKAFILSLNTQAENEGLKRATSQMLLEKMGEARQLGKTNFKIKCGTWIWGVHKEVLSANSSYLESTFAAQEEDSYLTMLELQPCGKDDAGSPDRYEVEYVEEFIHFFYNYTFSNKVAEMSTTDRLYFIAGIHRTATQFRATNAIKAMTNIFGDCLPQFNNHKDSQQVSGPELKDFAQVCRWVFAQPEFPDIVWELALYLLDYLKKNVVKMVKSKEMCDMLRDCIFEKIRDQHPVRPVARVAPE